MSTRGMSFTINLTARQVTRLLEQFARSSPQIQLEFRPRHGPEQVRGRVAGLERGVLLAALENASPDDLAELVGACVDVEIEQAGERYIFASALTAIAVGPNSRCIQLVVPDNIQVLNRRRFERTSATLASQVRINVPGHEATAIGLLEDIGGSGLSANLPGQNADDYLFVGDHVQVTFEIAGFDGHFTLPCVICTKEYRPAAQTLNVGLMFDVSPTDAAGNESLQCVRDALAELITSNFDVDDAT